MGVTVHEEVEEIIMKVLQSKIWGGQEALFYEMSQL